MARAEIPVTQLARNAGTVVATAGTVDATNNHVIPAGSVTGDFILYVNNTGDAGTVTFKAGDNPPALTASTGDLALDIGGTAELWIMVETARFTQSDGSINVDIDTDGTMSGDIAAYETRIASVS